MCMPDSWFRILSLWGRENGNKEIRIKIKTGPLFRILRRANTDGVMTERLQARGLAKRKRKKAWQSLAVRSDQEFAAAECM